MENHNYETMLKTINEKLGFDIRDYDKMDTRTECHECDNKKSPLEKLTIEELEFISKHSKSWDKKSKEWLVQNVTKKKKWKLRCFYVKGKNRI